MRRATLDFGIDLGTTNSAIAVLKGVTTEIIKNNLDHDITPSAVHIGKHGLQVGNRAKQRTLDGSTDTYTEFKRRMGTDYVYQFKSTGENKSAEELSAEVLKELKSDVQRRTGELIEAAVITVPAAFELHQCEATRKAAELAGFRQSPLLQEPVAAALAHGFQVDTQKSYWLIFDFGGGTFDAALIKSEEGTIHVVNHGGDNFLGGSDIDWALIDKIIAPRIAEEHGLDEFDRSHSGQNGRWRQAFARLKYAAEQAKIELTNKNEVFLDLGPAGSLRDESSGDVVVDDLDIKIARSDLIRVAEPIILRAVEITRRVINEKNLGNEAVEKVILVGGPTLAPYFREILSKSLGIPIDHSVDPLTVVARGAAVFAGTQKLESKGAAPTRAGEYSIDFKYKPVGMDSAPMVGGKVSGSGSSNFTGFTIELVNEKTQWRSGKIALRPDGVFIANLHAERGDRNSFAIELLDPNGRKQITTPDTLSYTVGAVVEEQPLIHSMGIALANNEYAKYFEKGRGLPLKATHDFKTVHPLRQGQTGDVLRVPVIEGDHEKADRNTKIGDLVVSASNIRRDLPAGSDVEVTLHIDESRTITVAAYFPFLDEEFPGKIDLGKRRVDVDFLSKDFNAELARLRDAKKNSANAKGGSAEGVVENIERSPVVQEVRDALSASKVDPDAAAKCEKRLLELKLVLDQAADALEWPTMVAEARELLGILQPEADRIGNQEQREKAGALAKEIEGLIEQKKQDQLRKKLEQTKRLYWEMLFAQPGFWVYQLQELEKKKSKMSDHARASHLFDQGRAYLENNNPEGLKNVVRQLWDLLPNEIAEATRRGYESGLVR